MSQEIIAHSVVVLPRLPDGSVLLQLRDDKAGIVYPGTVGLFGGSIENGETPAQAARRELNEELGIIPEIHEFRLLFEHNSAATEEENGCPIKRSVYSLDVPSVNHVTLREGHAIIAWNPHNPVPDKANPPAKRILIQYRSLN